MAKKFADGYLIENGDVTRQMVDKNYVHTDNNYTNEDKEKVASIDTIASELDNKVDAVEGMGLSSNDFTDAEKDKLASVNTPMQVKGRVDSPEDLPSDAVKGDVYLVGASGSEDFAEFVCVDDDPITWESLGRNKSVWTSGTGENSITRDIENGKSIASGEDSVNATYLATDGTACTYDVSLTGDANSTVYTTNNFSIKSLGCVFENTLTGETATAISYTYSNSSYEVTFSKTLSSESALSNTSCRVYPGAFGNGSFAEGKGIALGANSHAENLYSAAYGSNSHAEGEYTYAKGNDSHSEGYKSYAYGLNSHAEGNESVAYGVGSHSENKDAIAFGDYSHSEGGQMGSCQAIKFILDTDHSADDIYYYYTDSFISTGTYDKVTIVKNEGSDPSQTTVSVSRSSSQINAFEFFYNKSNSFPEDILFNKNYQMCDMVNEFPELVSWDGSFNKLAETNKIEFVTNSYKGESITFYILGGAIGSFSHVEGAGNYSYDMNHAEGNGNISLGHSTHTEGAGNVAYNSYIHAEGTGNYVSNAYSHIEGVGNTSTSTASHVEGVGNVSENSQNSHVEGCANAAVDSSEYSHVEGLSNSVKSSREAHAEGLSNNIYLGNDSSHIEGISNLIYNSNAAHVEGVSNKSIDSTFSHVEGANNKSYSGAIISHVEGTANSVYNGASQAHAEGAENVIRNSSCNCHAEGVKGLIDSSSNQAHTEGANNTVTNGSYSSHAEGEFNYIANTSIGAHSEGIGMCPIKLSGRTITNEGLYKYTVTAEFAVAGSLTKYLNDNMYITYSQLSYLSSISDILTEFGNKFTARNNEMSDIDSDISTLEQEISSLRSNILSQRSTINSEDSSTQEKTTARSIIENDEQTIVSKSNQIRALYKSKKNVIIDLDDDFNDVIKEYPSGTSTYDTLVLMATQRDSDNQCDIYTEKDIPESMMGTQFYIKGAVIYSPNSHSEGASNEIISSMNAHNEGWGNRIYYGNDDAHAEGRLNNISFDSKSAHAEGMVNIITDNSYASHAEGIKNKIVNARQSHVEGVDNIMLSDNSHIEGAQNKIDVNSSLSHIEGSGNNVLDGSNYSHIEGNQNLVTKATGTHIEGIQNSVNLSAIPNNFYSVHAEGTQNTVDGAGENSHIEGIENTIQTRQTHVEGIKNKSLTTDKTICTYGQASHIEGIDNEGTDSCTAHIEGGGNRLKFTEYSHIEGLNNSYSADTDGSISIHVEGFNNKLNTAAIISDLTTRSEICINDYTGLVRSLQFSHIEGFMNITFYSGRFTLYDSVYLQGLHIEGMNNAIDGFNGSHIEGQMNIAIGSEIHVEGSYNRLIPLNKNHAAHIEGHNNTLTATNSSFEHIEGFNNTINGSDTTALHVEGASNTFSGQVSFSHIGGQLNRGTDCIGPCLNVTGLYNSISGICMCVDVSGYDNKIDSSSDSTYGETSQMHLCSTISGQDNSIYNSSQFSTVSGRGNILASSSASWLGGEDNKIIGGLQSFVYGNENSISNTDSEYTNPSSCNVLFGYGNKLHGSKQSQRIGGFMYGNQNKLYAADNNFIFGTKNSIKQSPDSAILGGIENNIYASMGIGANFIIGGSYNKIESSVSAEHQNVDYSAIIASVGSIINGGANYCENVIIGGSSLSILSGSDINLLGGGTGNTINNGSNLNTILGGSRNTITNGSSNSAILAGTGNSIVASNQVYIMGSENIFGMFDGSEYTYGSCSNTLIVGAKVNATASVACSIIVGANTSVSEVGSSVIFGAQETVIKSSNVLVSGTNNLMNQASNSVIEGVLNSIIGGDDYAIDNSHVEGVYNSYSVVYSNGQYSNYTGRTHIEGESNFVTGRGLHVEGSSHVVSNQYYSHVEGFGRTKLVLSASNDGSENAYSVRFDNPTFCNEWLTYIIKPGTVLENCSRNRIKVVDVIISSDTYGLNVIFDTEVDLTDSWFTLGDVADPGFANHVEGLTNKLRGSSASHVSGSSNNIYYSDSSAIIGGIGNTMSWLENTAIIACKNVEATESNMVYVPALSLKNEDNEVKLFADAEGSLKAVVNGVEYYVSLSENKPGDDELTSSEVDYIYNSTNPEE